jgi:hypothetical protein
MTPGTIFTLTLRIRGKAGQASLHQLRALLKELLRRHKFRALDIREERPAQFDEAPTGERQ